MKGIFNHVTKKVNQEYTQRQPISKDMYTLFLQLLDLSDSSEWLFCEFLTH